MAVSDGDVLKVVLDISQPSAVVGQNVFYWQLDDPTPDNPSNAQIMTALDTKLTAMIGDIQTATADDYTYGDFIASKIEWITDKWVTVEDLGTGAVNVTGSSVNDSAPHGIAGTITAYTSRPQTRARKFLPGFSKLEYTDSTLSGTLLVALAAYVVEWLTNQAIVGSAELAPAVVGQSGPSAGLIYLLLSAAANGIAGYQRRRKPGVGS